MTKQTVSSLLHTKPVDKTQWLALLEQQLEEHIQEALQFQNMDESALSRPSATGGWSIAQNLSHLSSYGAHYLPRLKVALEKQPRISVNQPVVSSWLGAYFTRLMDPKTSRKKFKAAKQHQPTSDGENPQRIVAEFIDQQEELLRLLRLAGKADVNTGRIPTSVMPWLRLNISDTLQFVITHNERHIVQAKRSV